MKFYEIIDNFVKFTLNPKLYNIETIYSAAYQLTEDYYIYLEGTPTTEIIVNISVKDKTKLNDDFLEEGAKIFLNQLINYTYYKINSKEKELLRALLLQKSFENISLADLDKETVSVESYTEDMQSLDKSSPSSCSQQAKTNDAKKVYFDNADDDEELEFEDPDGIAIPWEDKFGGTDEN